MMELPSFKDDHVDDRAEEIVAECVTARPPVSFFLFAGAGSGKTRTLVNALRVIRREGGPQLRLSGRQVGVITYTNKACNEIKERIDHDNLFAVSTIHSFAWSLIKGLNADIRECLKVIIAAKIAKLQDEQARGRAGRASQDRARAIQVSEKRLTCLDSIRRFTYNPDGDNPEWNALNHSEVIFITSDLLTRKALMRSILVNRCPILLIDESQDTDKELIKALFAVQSDLKCRFALGIIGDMMQRIYLAGEQNLGGTLPDDWAKPVKEMNHRSGERIITLINKIRQPVDGQTQRGRADRGEGQVRLFICPSGVEDKPGFEANVCQKMAVITGDQEWLKPDECVKTLVLEHHMAAKRLGFLRMWEALNVEGLRTGLGKGDLPGVRFFSQLIMPLHNAHRSGDGFSLARVVLKYSPLLDKRTLKQAGKDQYIQVRRAKEAVEALAQLWSNGSQPSFLAVLKAANRHGLFRIPEVLRPYAEESVEVVDKLSEGEGEDGEDQIAAWRSFLETPFDQIEGYDRYVQGKAAYDTHQGIKGLEFPRVCVIMDDSEARGFMFSYEKLFGAKEDARARVLGQETSIDRTRRLLYVTCSRAEKSLALVAYTSNPSEVRGHVLRERWFEDDEVVMPE